MELIDNTQLILTCRDGIRLDRIPFELINISNFNQITSFSAQGFNGARGPFISIPSNICLLSNLQILDLSFNKIEIFSFNISSSCSLFSSLSTLDLSSNQLNKFPSEFTSNLSSLKNLYFQYNQLLDIPISAFYNVEYLQRLDFSYNNLTSFELWTFLVNISANYSNNKISHITNNENVNLSGKETPFTSIDLSNNGHIQLNDGIYEMYGVCSEVQYWLDYNDENYIYPSFTLSLYTINFGTTLIDCSCDLYYIRKLINDFSGSDFVSNYSLSQALCADGSTKFIEFNYTNCLTSTMNFSSLIPRLCKINESEPGNAPIYIPGQNYTGQTTTMISTTSTTITTTSSMINISSCFSTLSISDTNLIVTCPPNNTLALLPINSYTFTQLNQIIKLTVQGYANSRGSLVTIPPNICFLPNLLFLNVSFNRLIYLNSFFFSSNLLCLQNLQIFDLSNNFLTQFPSLFLTQLIHLDQLFLQSNQLTSIDLSIILLISSIVDLSNNQISRITNNANINFSMYTKSSTELYIDLTNNSQLIDFTDAIYEMYGACYEIQQLINTNLPSQTPLLTNGLLQINFNNSKINCSCQQYYIQRALSSVSNNYPLSNSMCTDGSLFLGNNKTSACSNSSVNFSNILPRFCKINPNESGLIPMNATDNTSIIIPDIYPYYLIQTMNNSYCIFTFYEGGIRVSINCINGSTMLTEISSAILMNTYFENITQVSINNQSSIDKLPSYLCVLPSTSIDLSNQSFTILDSNTFPCTLNTTLRYINLSYNQIILVNLTFINWIVIDLTSNNLSSFPYDLFNSSNLLARASTQQTLRLSSNNLTEFDLFICTYINSLIDLQNNPFIKSSNGYNIIRNNQNQSLTNEPTSSNLTLSNQLHFLINDEIAQNYNACDSRSFNILIQIFLYMKNNSIIIEIECQCSSFYLKEYYRLYNLSQFITDQFQCSNLSRLNQIQFESLTETNCSSSIVLSSDKLCQFESLNQDSSLSDGPTSNNDNRLLAIILGSILSSLGALLIIAMILIGIYCKRRSSSKAMFSTRDQFEERSHNLSWLRDLPSLDETTCRL